MNNGYEIFIVVNVNTSKRIPAWLKIIIAQFRCNKIVRALIRMGKTAGII